MGRKKREDSKGIVYLITFPNGKRYVGITTTSFAERKQSHISHRNTSNLAVHNALEKYFGEEIWEVIDTADDWSELAEKEIDYIKKFESHISEMGYNLTRGGDGTNGYEHTEEQRRKNSEAKISYFSDDENKAKLSEKIRQVHQRNPSLAERHSTFMNERFKNPEERKKVSKGMETYLSNEESLRKHSIQRGAREFLVHKKEGEFVGCWLTISECARDLGLSKGHISHCLHGKRKSHKGYVFVYK